MNTTRQSPPQILPVIMCGGSGTRLWPASRESMPKQFIPLLDDRYSSFQATVARVNDATVFDAPAVISSNDVRFIVAEQLAEVGVGAQIILEPVRRDSAAAVAVAACHALRRSGPDTVVLVLSADHEIADANAFVQSCSVAATAAAEHGFIMTLGVKPSFPSAGYGYICPGEPLADGSGARRVAQFVEKPDVDTARHYIDEGYLWNSGNFLFRAQTMVDELARYAPEVLESARSALEHSVVDLDFVRLAPEEFARAPKTSIDVAVMEKTQRAGVLPVSYSWSDIGSWGAIWDASKRDANGNALRGRARVISTRNSLVRSENTLATVVGLDDVVVVATPDAVLVSSRQRSEEVKHLVVSLKAEGQQEAEEHLRMYRPWGWYQRTDLGSRFQVKRIMVKPGARLSLQRHFHRAEHWVVVRGTAEVTINEQVILLHENEAAYIPIGAVHRLTNPGKIPLELIEVQVGSYTGEDDIVRVEDVYGRSQDK